MKTREDYLLKHEDRLLEALTKRYETANRQILLGYTSVFFVLLLDWGIIDRFGFGGATLSSSNQSLYAVVLPVFLFGLYVLVVYQLLSIAGTQKELMKNSRDIKTANELAQPIRLDDLRHFESGLAGLMAAIARRLAPWLARTAPVGHIVGVFTDIRRLDFLTLRSRINWFVLHLVFWGVAVAIPLLVILGLVLAPIALAYALVYSKSFTDGWVLADPSILFTGDGLPSLALTLIGGVGLATISACFILLASYVFDVLDAIADGFSDAAEEAMTAARSLLVRAQTIRFVISKLVS